MPQPTYSDVHINTALTQISVAYMQDASAYIADKVFPSVPVQHQSDLYYVFNKGDFFRDEAQQRADGTESAGSGYKLGTKTYSAAVWGLHKDVGPQTRRNADPAVDIDVVTSKWLMQRMLIRRDRAFVATYMKTGVWGTDVVGAATGGTPGTTLTPYWSDNVNGDPFTDLEIGQTALLQQTGQKGNILVIGWQVFQALKKSPIIIDRMKFSNPVYSGSVNEALLAQMFDVEQVIVSSAVYNSGLEGLADNMNFIMGKHALLCHKTPSPSLMEPTAGYIFPWAGYNGLNNNGIQIYQIPMDVLGRGTIRTEAEMAFDMQVVASDMGYFFSGIVA
jgi:hypothetical protein